MCVRLLRQLSNEMTFPFVTYTVKDIDNIESVQRRFTKRLPGFGALTYAERLRRLDIPSLELWRIHADLFLAHVNSRSRSLFAVARPSVVCLSSVCL